MRQRTRDVAAFARVMLGAVLASALLAWMAAAFFVGVVVMLAAKCVVLLAHTMQRLLVILRIVKPTTVSRCNRAAEDVIDV